MRPPTIGHAGGSSTRGTGRHVGVPRDHERRAAAPTEAHGWTRCRPREPARRWERPKPVRPRSPPSPLARRVARSARPAGDRTAAGPPAADVVPSRVGGGNGGNGNGGAATERREQATAATAARRPGPTPTPARERWPGWTTRRAATAAVAAGAATADREGAGAAPGPAARPEESSSASRSTSRVCSTSATRATASCGSTGFLPSKDDVYVSVKQARQFGLRKGDHADRARAARPAATRRTRRCCRSTRSTAWTRSKVRQRPRFEDLTPLFPDEKLRLEVAGDPTNMTARIVDLIAPIGKGQRGLIVSPPKAGKTTV